MMTTIFYLSKSDNSKNSQKLLPDKEVFQLGGGSIDEERQVPPHTDFLMKGVNNYPA